ncbi:MAG: GNAT family N-acetyltransferase [Pseudomonadota bacterium]
MQLELETSRLTLRPVGMTDAANLERTLCDAEVMRYVGKPLTPAALEAFMPTLTRRAAGGALGIWIASRKDTGMVIGDGILLPLPIDADDTEWEFLADQKELPPREVEVGYILRREAWGQGYATEICERLLTFGFANLAVDEIVAVTDPANAASMRVLTKSGMTNHGLRRAYACETTDFRVTRAAWEANANV